ncbi:MAG: preprotein translocase subunit secY [Candidatus Xenolissoclinum pacificiensis L6]|uniref:Protein translocase subunit SecY n=1 Tax=Candidatus Xenolissoclinum pacificiensis L6 TaxID=1401685 RepID=W2UYW4_9RICK|nr:MAG: preprotein translocase subunit secY [Candidatus Xenolissoclinum pacificiensis L6]
MQQLSWIVRSKEIKNRFLITIVILIAYRLGCYIPLPGIDTNLVRGYFADNASGFLGVFNVFSGGALSRMSLFSLNVMPYIVSSIIVQLLFFLFKGDNFRESSSSSVLSFYTKLLTIFVCVFQSIFILFGLEKVFGMDVILHKNISFFVIAIMTVLGSTLLLVWVAEQINTFGIGNGISLIIFVGIISELPSGLFYTVKYSGLGIVSTLFVFFILSAILFTVVYVERSYRIIKIKNPRKEYLYRSGGAHSADVNIPIKLNVSGVIPPIFAGSFLMLPVTVSSIFSSGGFFSNLILKNFIPGSFLYILLYVILIFFFSFFYSGFVFNAEQVAGSLKRSAIIIPGIRPGVPTVNYLRGLVKKNTYIGASYLSIICVLPELLRSFYYIPVSIGGTSFLIIVSVIMEIISQVQSYLFSYQYDNVVKKVRVFNK